MPMAERGIAFCHCSLAGRLPCSSRHGSRRCTNTPWTGRGATSRHRSSLRNRPTDRCTRCHILSMPPLLY